MLYNRYTTLKKYIAVFSIGYKNYTVYINDIIGINVIFVIRLIVVIFFLKAVYMGVGAKVIDGYTAEQVIRALIFVQAVVTSKPRITNDIEHEIKTGKIGVFLLNPISYIRFKFFQYLPTFLYNLSITLGIGLILGYFLVGAIHTTFLGVVGGILLLVGGAIITFFGYMMVGLLGFYTEDVGGWRLIYSKLDMILGGNILPIVFLPGILQMIAFASPFAYSGYTAGLMFVHFDTYIFLRYFGMQLLWIVTLVGICFVIYLHGKKKVTINGG